MLSPNAMYLRRDSWGSFVTLMLNEQLASRFKPSVTLQSTVVDPIGNVSPDSCEQLTLSGFWPPRVTGASNAIGIPAALIVPRAMLSLQVMAGASGGGGGGGGGVGELGELHPHATRTTSVQKSKRLTFTLVEIKSILTSYRSYQKRREGPYPGRNS